jgi:hypothetical protein
MRRKRILAAIGMMGVVAAAASCGDSSVRKYLGENGGPNALYAWEVRVGIALCQLEDHGTGLDPTKRYCPQGSTDPPAVPKYPPPEE